MGIFDCKDNERLGIVESVDTSSVIVKVEDDEKLHKLQVNRLVFLKSSKIGHHLVGIITKIMRKSLPETIDDLQIGNDIENIVKINLIGTFIDKEGSKKNIFRRTLETVPDIDSSCFILEEERLTNFMRSLSYQSKEEKNPLSIGNYTLDDNAEAFLNGNKLFQRHLVIAGSTGSGKSCTVALILEQISKLKSANALIFDIHGEYKPLIKEENFYDLKIAGPNDNPSTDTIFLPYWLLSSEETQALLLDRSDQNAPNQSMILSKIILEGKEEYNKKNNLNIPEITVDSPLPYNLSESIEKLYEMDTEMVTGSSGRDKQGPFHGKLTRFIQRLEAKQADKRLNFMFNDSLKLLDDKYLNNLLSKILYCSEKSSPGVKIVDCSEVPSDILPLITGLIARLISSFQMWSEKDKRHPIALFCDEAHLYIPNRSENSIDISAVNNFERISKEGRKYGIGLIVISQRPADVNRTVLSQSSNFIAMRLTNAEDQSVVKRLLPDNLGNFADLLPVLDIGEAIVVGDASLLPSRIRVKLPNCEPNSNTVEFWDEWSKDSISDYLDDSIEALKRQSRS